MPTILFGVGLFLKHASVTLIQMSLDPPDPRLLVIPQNLMDVDFLVVPQVMHQPLPTNRNQGPTLDVNT